MQSAIHIKTKVTQGRKIELELPQANVGEDVDVFVILSEPVQSQPTDVLELIAEIHSHRDPASSKELDQYLQTERDSWDS
jgi:hypothetical protein